MQQTQTYKLNKPGMDDRFSVEPLNENADTVDAVMAGLNQRMVTLEGCRMLMGVYHGTEDSDLVIDLGERPVAVLVGIMGINLTNMLLLLGDLQPVYKNYVVAQLTDSGFQVSGIMNEKYYYYTYLAFFGGWPTTGIPASEA